MLNFTNKVYCKDNIELLAELPNRCIDLIYCDILYGTGQCFGDYKDIKADKKVVYNFYIPRIKQMKRVLKDAGSIYIQCDWRINHWIRCIMDAVFGYDNFRRELVWCYSVQGYSTNNFSAKHDNILYYVKEIKNGFTFNLESIREDRPSNSTIGRFLPEALKKGFVYEFKSKRKIIIKDEEDFYKNFKGHPPYSWFFCSPVPGASKERMYGKYKTQKPKALLERIIKASSNKGDLVADFFCGSGTTIAVAKELGRKYWGCDISKRAIEITKKRLGIIC